MKKKILIVGNYKWNFYEQALANGFKSFDINTISFKLINYSFLQKILNFKEIKKVNSDLIEFVLKNNPDAIFFYRSNEIIPETLKKIKLLKPKLKLIFFHNDNPFYGFKNKLKYFFFLRCLKFTDITYVYRPSNLKPARKYKAKNVRLLFPHYCSDIHLANSVNFENKINEVVFIGHYEKDRGFFINKFVESNIKVKIFGGAEWKSISKKFKWPNYVVNDPVYGDDYFKIISESKIALCFLSKKNNDVYTRRIFEIPAMGTVVLSNYTEETADFFVPDKEILLYRNVNEMLQKANYFLLNEEKLKKITLNAFNKVVSSNHSEKDRAFQIITELFGDER